VRLRLRRILKAASLYRYGKQSTVSKIAYLAPSLPTLSETFVYEEIHALERRGIEVVPISVRKQRNPMPAQAELAQRTKHLYSPWPLITLIQSVICLLKFRLKTGTALRGLFSDMAAVGIFQSQSWKLAFQFLMAVKLSNILRQQQCTHLHVHFAHTPTQLAMYSSLLTGIPFTFTAHANDIFANGLLLCVKAQRASHVITISEFNLNYLQSLGVPHTDISIVRCGVGFAKSSRNCRVKTTRSNRPTHIGSLGRLVEKKGFDVLINALVALKCDGYNVKLHLAGDGPLIDELKSQTLSLGMSDSVIFEGPLEHNRVTSWMQHVDIFVLACKADQKGDMDGIPVVLMEAMSQFIPVVSTRLSGIPELVRHNETGLLATPGDWRTLSLEIKRLLDSPELRLHVSTNAHSFVKKEFAQAVNIDRLLTHFH